MPSRTRTYVKRPVPVRARQLEQYTTIKTLEGTASGEKGDYLVTGVRGETYIVKREIFEETYDRIADGD